LPTTGIPATTARLALPTAFRSARSEMFPVTVKDRLPAAALVTLSEKPGIAERFSVRVATKLPVPLNAAEPERVSAPEVTNCAESEKPDRADNERFASAVSRADVLNVGEAARVNELKATTCPTTLMVAPQVKSSVPVELLPKVGSKNAVPVVISKDARASSVSVVVRAEEPVIVRFPTASSLEASAMSPVAESDRLVKMPRSPVTEKPLAPDRVTDPTMKAVSVGTKSGVAERFSEPIADNRPVSANPAIADRVRLLK